MAARTIGKPDLNRLRVQFGKDGRLAFLGHLEVINTISRSVRRANLPFSVGNGFAQRMRIQFSQALPVGAASACEYYDIYLTERVQADDALARLQAATPRALAPIKAAYVNARIPALEAWLTRASWEVELLGTGEDFCAQGLSDIFAHMREEGDLPFMRGDKPRAINLQSTLLSWELVDGKERDGWKTMGLKLETRSSNLGALRPAVLIEGAFARPELSYARLDSLRVVRQAQHHENPDGMLVDPLAEGVLA